MRSWEEDVIVVTGFARTGTTLVQGLLAASGDVMEATAECAYLRDLATTHAGGRRDWDKFTYDLFADEAAYLDFGRRIVGLYIEQLRKRFGGGKRLLQKAPSIGPQVPALAELLPNAEFVVMLRDPRDVVASQLVRWRRAGRKLVLQDELTAYVQRYRLLRDELTRIPGRMAFVRYESLVQEPEATMERLCAFLGIRPPADAAATAWQHKRVPGDPSASALDGQPVSPDAVGTYRRILPAPMLSVIEGKRAQIEEMVGLPVFFDPGETPGPAVMTEAEAVTR